MIFSLIFAKLSSALISFRQHEFAFPEDSTLLEQCHQLKAFLQQHRVGWNDASLATASVEERLSLAACLRSQDPRQINGPLHELLGQFEEVEMTQLGPYQALLLTRQPSNALLTRIFGFDEDSEAAGEEAIIGDLQKAHAQCVNQPLDCLEKGLYEVAELFTKDPMPISGARKHGNRLAQFLIDALAWPEQEELIKQVRSRLDRLYSQKPLNKPAIERLLAEYALKTKLIIADQAVEVYPTLLRANYEV